MCMETYGKYEDLPYNTAKTFFFLITKIRNKKKRIKKKIMMKLTF